MHLPDGFVPRLRRSVRRGFVVSAFGLLLAAPTFGTPLPPTQNPLPGSAFQGADGNQDDAAPRIDWQGLSEVGRVEHSPGSKEDRPGEWDLTTEAGGVRPAGA